MKVIGGPHNGQKVGSFGGRGHIELACPPVVIGEDLKMELYIWEWVAERSFWRHVSLEQDEAVRRFFGEQDDGG